MNFQIQKPAIFREIVPNRRKVRLAIAAAKLDIFQGNVLNMKAGARVARALLDLIATNVNCSHVEF